MLPWNISAVGTCRGSMASETLRIALKLFLSHHRLVSNESWIYCKDLQESPWSYHNHIMTISWPYHGDIMMFHFIGGMLVGRRRNMYPNKHKKTAMREHIYWAQACLNTLASGLHCSQGLPLDIFRSIRTVADYLHGLCAMLHPRFDATFGISWSASQWVQAQYISPGKAWKSSGNT